MKVRRAGRGADDAAGDGRVDHVVPGVAAAFALTARAVSTSMVEQSISSVAPAAEAITLPAPT